MSAYSEVSNTLGACQVRRLSERKQMELVVVGGVVDRGFGSYIVLAGRELDPEKHYMQPWERMGAVDKISQGAKGRGELLG